MSHKVLCNKENKHVEILTLKWKLKTEMRTNNKRISTEGFITVFSFFVKNSTQMADVTDCSRVLELHTEDLLSRVVSVSYMKEVINSDLENKNCKDQCV